MYSVFRVLHKAAGRSCFSAERQNDTFDDRLYEKMWMEILHNVFTLLHYLYLRKNGVTLTINRQVLAGKGLVLCENTQLKRITFSHLHLQAAFERS